MARNLFFLLICCIAMSECTPPSGAGSGEHAHTNKLIDESSPYLLQHAHNPVDWYPWGEEALQKAREEDKLLIISIGYAACHWCHVMEHESFEDSAVAAIMNEHFVSIKVDREERPDIDDVYMTACQMASGRGCGWPLNAFALPDGRPVWAGTYFPKKQWLNIIDQFINLKSKEPAKLEEYANQLVGGIQQMDQLVDVQSADEFQATETDKMAERFLAVVDMKEGGRKGAPKFPMPVNWEFLMHYSQLSGNQDAADAVTTTLDHMARGGIYDQVGGGFARYSVDGEWHVPHFEKMLYDNGQLVSLYSNAYKWTGDEKYRRVVEETLEFVERELMHSDGGFYSSLDADSEGEEGKFYVWTDEEFRAAIEDQALAELAARYFDVQPGGNWKEEKGKNVLRITVSEQALANSNGISREELLNRIDQAKKILLEKRASRVRPPLDDKILTSWNALMQKGYITAYQAFKDQHFLDVAKRNAQFVKDNMWREDGGLNRNFKNGSSSINAFLDDYGLLIDAWIAMYEATFDEAYLYDARKLADYAVEHFYDEETGMFFYTSDIDPPLVARKKELTDNVIPGSNSVMAETLHKLGLYFYDQGYLDKSVRMLANMAPTIETTDQPFFYSNWCNLYAHHKWPLFEVAIVGSEFEARQQAWNSRYLPNSIILGGPDEGSLQLLEGKLQDGETFIYVCQNKVCKFPVTEVEKAVGLMN